MQDIQHTLGSDVAHTIFIYAFEEEHANMLKDVHTELRYLVDILTPESNSFWDEPLDYWHVPYVLNVIKNKNRTPRFFRQNAYIK